MTTPIELAAAVFHVMCHNGSVQRYLEGRRIEEIERRLSGVRPSSDLVRLVARSGGSPLVLDFLLERGCESVLRGRTWPLIGVVAGGFRLIGSNSGVPGLIWSRPGGANAAAVGWGDEQFGAVFESSFFRVSGTRADRIYGTDDPKHFLGARIEEGLRLSKADFDTPVSGIAFVSRGFHLWVLERMIGGYLDATVADREIVRVVLEHCARLEIAHKCLYVDANNVMGIANLLDELERIGGREPQPWWLCPTNEMPVLPRSTDCGRPGTITFVFPPPERRKNRYAPVLAVEDVDTLLFRLLDEGSDTDLLCPWLTPSEMFDLYQRLSRRLAPQNKGGVRAGIGILESFLWGAAFAEVPT